MGARGLAAVPGVADQRGGLVLEGGRGQVVDRILEDTGDRVVVLGGHEHDSVERLDVGAQAHGLGQGRGLHRGGHLLSEEGQIVVTKIDEDGVDALDLERLLLDPARHLLARTTGANGTENDSNGSHDVSFRGIIETSSTLHPATFQNNPFSYRLGHKSYKLSTRLTTLP